MADQQSIALAGIGVTPSDRLRALRPDKVAELAESMQANGLLQPIVVRPLERGKLRGYQLIAGHHRLEAAKKLKWPAIDCVVLDPVDDDHARLAEIDENLIRADLSPAERAGHTDARKAIYERLRPDTKHGGAPGKAGGGKKAKGPNLGSFVTDTAAKTGRSKTAVKRDVTRGKRIPNVARLAGTSLDKGDELDALAKLPSAEQSTVMDAAMAGRKVSARQALKAHKRSERERALGGATKIANATAAQTDKRYGVIHADPPWRFEPYSRDTGLDRAADNHYPTMTLDEIMAIPIPAAPDAVLFLWATVPMLPQALDVMAGWGFTYRSLFSWAKDRIGTGYWTRNQNELLLIGTRGDIPAPAPGNQYSSHQPAPVGEHSAKPPVFAEMIEEMFPTLPRLEMFARTPRPSWDVWGNEAHAPD